MKKSISAFSLIEIIVGSMIIGLSILGLVQGYSFLMNKSKYIDNSITNQYFNKYVFNLVNIIDIPTDLSKGNKIYLDKLTQNLFTGSLSPEKSKLDLGFTLENNNYKFYHEIELYDISTIDKIDYFTYKITTRINENQKISFITK